MVVMGMQPSATVARSHMPVIRCSGCTEFGARQHWTRARKLDPEDFTPKNQAGLKIG